MFYSEIGEAIASVEIHRGKGASGTSCDAFAAVEAMIRAIGWYFILQNFGMRHDFSQENM